MVNLPTTQYVAGLTAEAAYEFLLDFETREYQAWWPGTHLLAKPLRRRPGHVGNLTRVEQYIGPYRLNSIEEVVEVVPAKKIVVRIRGLMGLPVRMSYEFADDEFGVTMLFTLQAGFRGWLRVLNPLFRVYFTQRFAAALEAHMKEEFLRLASLAACVGVGASTDKASAEADFGDPESAGAGVLDPV